MTQFAHLRIPLDEIVEATNNFSDRKIIGKGDLGNVYRGKLIRSGRSIKIAARRLTLDRNGRLQGEVEFWTEISMLYTLDDQYVVSLIGYCYEKGEKIIVNRYYPKGSLLKYLGNQSVLDWFKILYISSGLSGIIHYIQNKLGQGYYVVHRNVNSSTLVLNNVYGELRLSGFEHSIKHSVERKEQVFVCEAIGTRGYMAPEIVKSGGVTHKSDIYSVGVVLFEMLCGRKANEDNKPLLGPLAKFHYENGTLEEIIDPDLWKQMKPESINCFSEVAYSCLQEDPTLRPDADQLNRKLKKHSNCR